MNADPRDLADLALDVARAAADLVRHRRRAGVSVADTKSSATDVVTEVDHASEDLIREQLLARRPDDGVLGEEGDDIPSASGVRWIVDPIDGTVNFYYGIPTYAVSIAAEVADEVVAGVVLNIATGTEYVAVRGAGAVRDGVPLAARRPTELGASLMATGFGYRPDARRIQAEGLVGLLPRVRDLRRFGSSALDLCMVAEGVVDCYVEEGVHPWDYSAGALMVSEAGARVTLLPSRWDGQAIVAAPDPVHDELLAAAQETGYLGRSGE